MRIGVGGPVGSGKTTLVEVLCKRLRVRYQLAVVTNDIYTKEDERLLVAAQALPAERVMGVETGGCPHTAIREDAAINLDAVKHMCRRFPDLDLTFIESGGEKIPRKGGPGITRSDLPVIDKIDLAPHVGASLDVRGTTPNACAAAGRPDR